MKKYLLLALITLFVAPGAYSMPIPTISDGWMAYAVTAIGLSTSFYNAKKNSSGAKRACKNKKKVLTAYEKAKKPFYDDPTKKPIQAFGRQYITLRPGANQEPIICRLASLSSAEDQFTKEQFIEQFDKESRIDLSRKIFYAKMGLTMTFAGVCWLAYIGSKTGDKIIA